MKKDQLEQCIHEYGKDIYSFCKHLTCNQQEADDLYQDTFLKAIELEEKIDFQNNPKSYLLSIALRIWKNQRRKYAWRKRIAEIGFFKEGQETGVKEVSNVFQKNTNENFYELSPEEQMLKREEAEIVRQMVEYLPEKLKVVVLLFYMEELSVAEIASVLKIPQGTVKSRLYQARKRLEKELEVVLDEKRN